MKNTINKIIKIVKFETTYSGHELFIAVGFFMAFGTLLKLLGVYDFSSDWFWFIAGIGLVIEGFISLVKQKRFNQKYKILSKEEFDKLTEGKI